MAAIFNRSCNHKLWGDWKAKATKSYSIQPKWIILKFYFNCLPKTFFGEVQGCALIGSKLSTQEVQSIRTLIFKM